jgi:CcmD family protein
MNKFSSIAILFILSMIHSFANAQTANQSADLMRSNGKIYVVIAVVVVIVLGIFIYLLNLDKKISRLEKENNTKP